MQNLPHLLKEWTDPDYALYCVGVSLGLWQKGDFQTVAKGVVNSNNEVARWLSEILFRLEGFGMVERKKTTKNCYRWVPGVERIFTGRMM